MSNVPGIELENAASGYLSRRKLPLEQPLVTKVLG